VTATAPRVIHLAHSPDADDAFMFWAMAEGKIDTGGRRYLHELADIETLNRRALAGELEVTAVSIHAYAHLADRYALLAHGASIGDRYPPIREPAWPAAPSPSPAPSPPPGSPCSSTSLTCGPSSCHSIRSRTTWPRGSPTPAC